MRLLYIAGLCFLAWLTLDIAFGRPAHAGTVGMLNNLSWFLYAADVIPSIGSFCGVVAILCLFMLGVGTLLYGIENEAFWWQGWSFLLPIAFVAGLLSCIVPSKETLYKIAASEIGETIVKNPTVQQEALEIYQQLKDLLKPAQP